MLDIHASENRGDHGIRGSLFHGHGSPCEFQGHGGRHHIDVTDFLGTGFQKQVAIFRGAARAPGLEEVLQAHANFSLDPADRLLKSFGKKRIRAINPNLILKLSSVVVEHGFSGDSLFTAVLAGGISLPASVVPRALSFRRTWAATASLHASRNCRYSPSVQAA